MKLSISSYSFAQYTNAGKLKLTDLPDESVRLGVHTMDYTGLPGTYEERAALATEIRRRADTAGVSISCYAVKATMYQPDDSASETELARLRTELEIAHILGAPVLRHDTCFSLDPAHGGRSFDAMLPVMAKNARTLTEMAAEYGIRTCTENHGMIAQDSERVERLYNAVGHDNFGLLVDIGNFACVDEDSVAAVSRLAPYAFHVHAKDFFRRTFEEGGAPGYFRTRGAAYLCGASIGEGVIPVRHCLHILRNAGYDGAVAVEYEGQGDCIEGIRRGLAYLTDVFAGF